MFLLFFCFFFFFVFIPLFDWFNFIYYVDNMKELFQDIHVDSIMTFLRQINLFNKI